MDDVGGLVSLREYLGGGISLRDWFAGQALSGMLVPNKFMPADAAEAAYAYADAMLAERVKVDG